MNPRPADYESAALPTVPLQLIKYVVVLKKEFCRNLKIYEKNATIPYLARNLLYYKQRTLVNKNLKFFGICKRFLNIAPCLLTAAACGFIIDLKRLRGWKMKMQRTKLSERELPDYTKGEEIFNMVSHIAGGALGLAALVLCVVFSALHKNVYGVVASAIYGATMIILYTMSSIYHGLRPNLMAKKVFQVIDHCSIFLLIAGTYTPLALCSFREYSAPLGWWIFGVIWGSAVLGIVLNAIDIKKYKRFSMICYLAMGWCIVFAAKATYFTLGFGGTAFLIAGGILYTIGAVLYAKAKNHRYMHSVFHLFVVFGSVLHFFCILLYVV